MTNGKNNKTSNSHKLRGAKKKIFELRLNLTPKNFFLWSFIILIVLFIFISARDISKLFPEKPLSTLVADVRVGEVQKIEVVGDKLLATYKDGKIYSGPGGNLSDDAGR